MFTAYEAAMIQAIFDYSRIPLWNFDSTINLIETFTCDMKEEVKQELIIHVTRIMRECKNPEFDILCYENEIYFIFSYKHQANLNYLVAGPMLLTGIYHITEIKSLSFASSLSSKDLFALVENLPVVTLNSFSSCLNILMLLLNRPALSLHEISNLKFSYLQGSFYSTLLADLFDRPKEDREHTPYNQELALLHCVKEGDISKLESLYHVLPRIKYGRMSNYTNPIRQLFYGSIANTTLVTRYAIEGGLDEETAFTLSDLYIKKMEGCNTLYELNLLNEKMALDFTKRVAKVKELQQASYSKAIAVCIDYIVGNIQNKISLDDLASHTNLTPKYLSALFRKETGQTIRSFILDAKMEKAKNLLAYSQFTYSEISQYLSFYSQSHFISMFKRQIGMTPKEFRDKNYKTSW